MVSPQEVSKAKKSVSTQAGISTGLFFLKLCSKPWDLPNGKGNLDIHTLNLSPEWFDQAEKTYFFVRQINPLQSWDMDGASISAKATLDILQCHLIGDQLGLKQNNGSTRASVLVRIKSEMSRAAI